ncbi:Post-SET domain-containing protein [Artemisia annua]|uniref:Post-SET domain-containing protein n=1 Tax=Artemisia annua TaxID=35608 RepID=A0A2U1NKB5_ARTAN|nr:Post-SET domain-containing protein [Artemisia annua]
MDSYKSEKPSWGHGGLAISKTPLVFSLNLPPHACSPHTTLFLPLQRPANGEVSLLGTTETVDYPTDTWADIVVEARNNQEIFFNNLETTPVNKTKQCTTFIEAKGRQCARWANDGDIYCCVHLSVQFYTNIVKVEVAPPSADANMCGGTTVICTRCKHWSLPALVSPPESTLKRKIEEVSRDLPEANSCKEIVLPAHFGTPQEYNSSEPMHCLGIGDGVRCNETPKKHTPTLFAYDSMEKTLAPKPGEQVKLHVLESLIAGACAGISSICTYPLKLLKTRLLSKYS